MKVIKLTTTALGIVAIVCSSAQAMESPTEFTTTKQRISHRISMIFGSLFSKEEEKKEVAITPEKTQSSNYESSLSRRDQLIAKMAQRDKLLGTRYRLQKIPQFDDISSPKQFSLRRPRSMAISRKFIGEHRTTYEDRSRSNTLDTIVPQENEYANIPQIESAAEPAYANIPQIEQKVEPAYANIPQVENVTEAAYANIPQLDEEFTTVTQKEETYANIPQNLEKKNISIINNTPIALELLFQHETFPYVIYSLAHHEGKEISLDKLQENYDNSSLWQLFVSYGTSANTPLIPEHIIDLETTNTIVIYIDDNGEFQISTLS